MSYKSRFGNGDTQNQIHKPRSNFWPTLASVIGVHILVCSALLVSQGCGERKTSQAGPPQQTTNEVQALLQQYTTPTTPPPTNVPASITTPPLPEVVSTNPPSTLFGETTGVATVQIKGTPPSTSAEGPTQQVTHPNIILPTTEVPEGETNVPPSIQTEYVIQPGDYPLKIAKKFGISLQDLYDANPGLNPRRLIPGQKLKIPKPQPKPAQAEAPTIPGAKVHVIEPGDTPIKIARQYGITLDELYEANPGLEPRRLIPGHKLIIPEHKAKSTSQPTTSYPGTLHKVSPGETLIKIARQYGVTVKAIREENHLQTDRILVGQILKIPTHKKSTGTQ